MSRSEKPTKAFTLSLIAGIFILSNTALLGVAARWFPGMIPTLPGSSANDTTVLFRLTAVGLIFGVLVLLGAILLRIRPAHKKAWGIMILVFSIPSIVTGGGFIIGFILGIIGGALALSRKSNVQA
ncbi:MAG TPA: hypothetical protein DSN98_02895 [Thermoplasmata archaeon]|jgi:hypothetical protein|nr:MAG TPA: hypothetical protein DSN98_02895 [Thermoplasmata archaeon]